MSTEDITQQGHCPFSLMNLQSGDPFPVFDTARAQSPVHWDHQLSGWAVLTYELCKQVETDEQTYGIGFPDPAPQVVLDIKGGRGISVLIGDEHRKLRQFFMSLLTSKNVASSTQHQVIPITDFLMDKMLEKGSGNVDLARDLADEMPPRVIAALLGMPWEDDALVTRIRDLHEELMEVMGDGYRTQSLLHRGLEASAEINEMLLPYIRMRRENPQNDLVSRLWREAPKYVGELTEQDVVSMGRDLFIAGADTTVHGIANSLYLALTDPGVRSAVETRSDEMLSVAVEEAMRLFGSVMYRFRKASVDCELGGQAIAKGDRLILVHSAANRDPSKYTCPHNADLTRRPENDHLAFNKGPRKCIGSGFARAEMMEALRAVFARMPNVRLDPKAEQPRYDGLFLRSWRPLHVLFDA